MTNRQTASKSLLLGWLLPPLLGAATAAVLYLLGERLRPALTEPWDDLLEKPFLLAQAAFVAAAGFLLLEWAVLRRRQAQVKAMTVDDRTSWPGAARQSALTSFHPRPRKADRERQLKRYRVWLGWRANLFWLGYVALAVTPAMAGLLVGLRSARLNHELGLGFLAFFIPLLVGIAEGAILWLPGAWLGLRTRRLLDEWYDRAIKLEEAPQAPPSDSTPVDRPQRAAIATAPARVWGPATLPPDNGKDDTSVPRADDSAASAATEQTGRKVEFE